ncbi:MAG: hypothetical protein YHS30scaffold324_9 [Catenulispora phage 69_17]|nr:MAG: hypothetical protein YHS30scaffold324_9 [Catenulispora phage 69_17]
MTVAHFKPTYWSKVLFGSLEKQLVFGSEYVVNHDYEGEITGAGDSVNITSIADPTVSDYSPNGTITYETPNDTGQTVLIDQAKYFAVSVDDVDAAQAAGNMLNFMENKAGYKVSDAADQFVAGLYTSAAPANSIGSSGSPKTPAVFSTTTPADFYTQVVLPLGVKLTEANVPNDGRRYIIVPPWAEGLITETAAFVQYPNSSGGAGEVMANGFMGRLGKFNVLVSNNAVNYSGSNWIIQAGHPSAITFANQIVKTEALRLQTKFADAVRGLHVYGAKVIAPERLAVAYVTRPAGI